MPRTRTKMLEPENTQDERIIRFRYLLRGVTWGAVCKSTANPTLLPYGVWFYGRIGLWLNRPTVAVCAEDTFAVLKFIGESYVGNVPGKLQLLTGKPERGWTLFLHDLPMCGLKPGDLVITEGD